MPHLLALDWDNHEARIAVAQKHAGRLVVEQAVSRQRPPRSTDPAQDASALAAALADMLSSCGLAHVKTLVAVGRSSIELKHLSLPPAPPDELPGMVRFQAQREFTALTDDWLLDYLPLAGGGAQPHELLAAALAPDVLAQIVATCRSAGLKPRRAVLRPCAAASLLVRQRPAENERIRLLVDLLDEEVELTALADQDVVFMRAVRLPVESNEQADHDERRQVLEAEIRRTIAAVRNQLGGPRVNAIHLCSDEQEGAELAAWLQQRLSLPTYVFDPLAEVALAGAVRTSRPDHAGRFAPLIGMLLDESQNVAPGIDFLHPRRVAPRQSHWQLIALATAAALLLGAGLALRTWTEIAQLDDRIALVQQQLAGLDTLLERSTKTTETVAQLEQWAMSDTVWLDELCRLSDRLPSAADVMLTRVQLVPDAGSGTLVLNGRVGTHETIDKLERDLRDAGHRIDPKMSQQDGADSRYTWQFKSSMTVSPARERTDE